MLTEPLRDDVKGLKMDYSHLGKFARSAQEFADYVRSNTGSLINYGERFRAGERISSAMAESTVNAVVSKRFAKRQQMQWTRRGTQPAAANPYPRPRRHAPTHVRTVASRPGQRQPGQHRSGGSGVNTPHFLMVPWRTVDQTKTVLGILVQSKHDMQTAKRLLRKLQCRPLRFVNTDKLASYRGASGRRRGNAGLGTLAGTGAGLAGRLILNNAKDNEAQNYQTSYALPAIVPGADA